MNIENPRKPQAGVDPMFPDRWSPRAFSSKPVPEDTLMSLFEAARWAPSSRNEQPWIFLYAVDEDDLAVFRPLLTAANRVWADKAPALAFALAKRRFDFNGKVNRHAVFDTGSAWMSLALQARRKGLYAHAMAGFDLEMAYEALGVPKDEYEVVCAIAIGYYGDAADLPPDLQKTETPSDRKPLKEVARRGRFDG